MRKYETVIAFASTLSDAQVKEETNKIEDLLKTGAVAELKADFWGKKEIAYRTKGDKFAHYVVLSFTTGDSDKEIAVVDTLTRQLRITESILLFQTVRIGLPKRKFQGNPKRKPQGDSGDDFSFGMDAEF